MKAIVAVDNEFGIGAGNDLLYHIPADKKRFREKTVGKVVVMGRKTFMSLPAAKPLKDRINVVLTRDPAFEADGAVVVRGEEELLDYLKRYKTDDVFVIGGGEVYKKLLPLCDEVLITKIYADKPADVFFPNIIESDEWRLSKQSVLHEYDGMNFRFCVYKRTQPENGA